MRRWASRGRNTAPRSLRNTFVAGAPPSEKSSSAAARSVRSALRAGLPRMQRRCFDPLPVTITPPVSKLICPHVSDTASEIRQPVE